MHRLTTTTTTCVDLPGVPAARGARTAGAALAGLPVAMPAVLRHAGGVGQAVWTSAARIAGSTGAHAASPVQCPGDSCRACLCDELTPAERRVLLRVQHEPMSWETPDGDAAITSPPLAGTPKTIAEKGNSARLGVGVEGFGGQVNQGFGEHG